MTNMTRTEYAQQIRAGVTARYGKTLEDLVATQINEWRADVPRSEWHDGWHDVPAAATTEADEHIKLHWTAQTPADEVIEDLGCYA